MKVSRGRGRAPKNLATATANGRRASTFRAGRLGLVVAMTSSVLFIAPSQANASTRLDLGTFPGGTSSTAYDISESGEVVGSSDGGSFPGEHPFFWSQSTGMIDILPPGFDGGVARGVNESGEVFGSTFKNGQGEQAFTWSLSGGTHLIDPVPGDDFSVAIDINNNGDVVGYSRTLACCSSPNHAFIWNLSTGTVGLGGLGGGDAYAQYLDDAGEVTGSARLPSGDFTVFKWTSGGGMVNIAPPGWTDGNPFAISETGQIVGSIQIAPGGDYHAFSWTQTGGMVDLGVFGGNYSYAYAVNDVGTVVGSSTTASGDMHGFLWKDPGPMVDLGSLGGSNALAVAVNNNDQVVGSGQLPSGYYHPFLWTDPGPIVDLGVLGGEGGGSINSVNDSGFAVGSAAKRSNYSHATMWNLGAPDDTTPPTVNSANFSVNPVVQGDTTVLTVDVSDNIQVADVEYWDTAYGPGTAQPLDLTGSMFTKSLTGNNYTLGVAGTHTIAIRAIDAVGNSTVTTLSLDISPDDQSRPRINSLRWEENPVALGDSALLTVDASDNVGVSCARHIDSDPGQGQDPVGRQRHRHIDPDSLPRHAHGGGAGEGRRWELVGDGDDQPEHL